MDEVAEVGGGLLAEESQDHSGLDQPERSASQPVARQSLKKLGRLPPYFTIGHREKINVVMAMKRPLSGYIGGDSAAGYWVTKLADEWSQTFGVTYAVPCNSATSGLMAACMAAEIGEGDLVWVSTYTMSATATCAMILGAEVKFLDIDPDYFLMSPPLDAPLPKAIIVTNLFGLAQRLQQLREFCDEFNIILIEDNAQAPFATDNGVYAGTIGHMGVFSLNVHKHIQCGEGGVVVTNEAQYAHRLDCAINHGELCRTNPHMGLNLRMTEPIAAIASAQLKKGPDLVQSRIHIAETLNDIFRVIPFVQVPTKRENCDHVYYLWAGKIKGDGAQEKRNTFVERLQARGIPMRCGYSPPLHRLLGPADDKECPVVSDIEDNRLFTFEICAYDPKAHHLTVMTEIIHDEANRLV